MGVTMYKWLLVCLACFGLASFSTAPATPARPAHPFYVSVVEINHNAQEKTLEVSCKIFVDDLEAILKQNFKASVDLGNDGQETRNGQLIHDYISKHLSLSADGKAAKLSFIGFEREKAYAWCYFEVTGISSIKKLDVTNSILHDYKEEQINIMHININGNRKSYKLDFPNTKASFSF
jgi:hypothetical protein